MSTKITFNTPSTDAAAPEGHEERMIALVDGQNKAAEGVAQEQAQAGQEGQQRPAWLPEKFTSPEALAEAYAALERRLSAGQTKAAEGGTETATAETTTETEAKAQAAKAGVDYAAITAEFAEKGALSDATYADLDAKGFPRDVVDSYIAGQQALAAQARSALETEVGGKEAMESVLTWAKTGLSDAQKTAWNDAIGRGNPAELAMILKGFQAAMTAAEGGDPQRRIAAKAGKGGVAGFASEAEMVQAMRDPRYGSDPAYRAEVRNRIAAAAW